MRSSVARLKLPLAAWAVMGLCACSTSPLGGARANTSAAHAAPPADQPLAAPTLAPAISELSLESLERAEFEHSSDPDIKLQLASKLWCQGRRGQAFEHWLWLKRATPRSQPGVEAIHRLEQARSAPDGLTEDLACPR